MTRVCLVGEPEVDLRSELLASETARAALATYDLETPFTNSLAVETVSLGAAVSLLNDLNWYLIRYVDEALVLEPSVSDDEWLSRALAEDIRNEHVDRANTGHLLKIFGVDDGRLVEPMYVTRMHDDAPEYDLREVEDTVVVRVTKAEFER